MAGTGNSGGHARKTRQQLERAGTFRADRHAGLNSPEPPAGDPTQPAELEGKALEEWARMVERLRLSQSLFVVDDAAVYQYCRLYAETEHIAEDQQELRASVQILETNIRDVEKSDLVQLFSQIVTLRKDISKCTDQLRQGRATIRQYLVEFGLTPASRGRVKLPPKENKTDAFTAFQQKRTA